MVGAIDSIFSSAKKQNQSGKFKPFKPSAASKFAKPVAKLGVVLARGSTKGSKTSNVETTKRISKQSGSSSDPFALSAKTKGGADLTEEGWTIYTPEELQIGKGGDTDMCPFDCDCCY